MTLDGQHNKSHLFSDALILRTSSPINSKKTLMIARDRADPFLHLQSAVSDACALLLYVLLCFTFSGERQAALPLARREEPAADTGFFLLINWYSNGTWQSTTVPKERRGQHIFRKEKNPQQHLSQNKTEEKIHTQALQHFPAEIVFLTSPASHK